MRARTFGLVGCGNWGKFILRDLKSLGCHVSVLAISPKSVANARAAHADQLVSSIEELVQSKDLQGVVVASPTSTHSSVLKQLIALRPNLPLFCEKPVACSRAELQELLHIQPNNIFVMDKWRYHPGVLKLAEIAKEKTLGDLIGIRTERLGWGIPHPDANAVWHLLPHDLSIVVEILGYLPDVRYSHVETLHDQCLGVSALLGASPWVSCTVSIHWPLRIRRVQLVCTEGIALLEDGYATAVKLARGPLDRGDISPTLTEIPIDTTLPLFAELKTFVEYILENGPAPKSPLVEAARSVEIIEQALQKGVAYV